MKKVVGSYKKRREEESQSNSCRFEGLAVDIIWDILSRLPIKACLNCKLVCKAWYAVITNPDFGDQRRDRGRYFSVFLQGKFNGWHKESLLLELDKSSIFHNERGNLLLPDDAKIRFRPKLMYPNWKLKLVNECNGLLCFKTEPRWSCFVICNPLTSQQVTVRQAYKAGYRVVSCGLGYSPALHRYKMLRILMPTSSKHENKYCVAEVHTLGNTQQQQQQGWRRLNGRAPVIAYQRSNAFLNGSLHGCCYSSKRIWSFNFDTEQFSLVPLSEEIRNIGVIHGVTIFESSLCCTTSHVLNINNGFVMSHIWVMKEYGSKDSWVKLFSLGACYDQSPLPLFGPFDNGDMVVSFAGANPEYECVFAVFSYEVMIGYLQLLVRGEHPSLVATCNTNFSKLPASMTITKHQHPRPRPKLPWPECVMDGPPI